MKVDISLTRDIDTDRGRRALASALISFAEEMDIDIVAEGIETDAELEHARRPWGSLRAGLLPGRTWLRCWRPSERSCAPAARRSIAHEDEPVEPLVNCFISVATATASA